MCLSEEEKKARENRESAVVPSQSGQQSVLRLLLTLLREHRCLAISLILALSHQSMQYYFNYLLFQRA